MGGLTWFAIPFTLATTMGLAYLGLSSSQAGTPHKDSLDTKLQDNGNLVAILGCKLQLSLHLASLVGNCYFFPIAIFYHFEKRDICDVIIF